MEEREKKRKKRERKKGGKKELPLFGYESEKRVILYSAQHTTSPNKSPLSPITIGPRLLVIPLSVTLGPKQN